jgi:hypothetical protein
VDVDIFTCLDQFKVIIVLAKTRLRQKVHSLAQCSAGAPQNRLCFSSEHEVIILMADRDEHAIVLTEIQGWLLTERFEVKILKVLLNFVCPPLTCMGMVLKIFQDLIYHANLDVVPMCVYFHHSFICWSTMTHCSSSFRVDI